MHDSKKIIVKNFISLNNEQGASLNLLYRPIIGNDSTNIYLMLQNISNENIVINFSHIMNIFNISEKLILDSLKKLLAVNLINYIDDGIYLIHPKNAFDFFNNTFLYHFLRKTIGEKTCEFLRESLSDNNSIKKDLNYDLLEEIFGFDKKEEYRNRNDILPLDNSKDFLYKVSNIVGKKGIEYNVGSDIFVDNKLFELSKIYNFSDTDIAKIYVMSIDMNRKISVNKVENIALKMYELNNENNPKSNNQTNDLNSRISIVDFFERKNPIDFLKMCSPSGEVSSADARLVDLLLKKYKLSHGVSNVLLHYVMKEKKGKLPKTYIEKLASSWDREGINSTQIAIDHIKHKPKEEQKYNKKSDVIPKWILDDNINNDDLMKNVTTNIKSTEDVKAKIEELING